MADKPMTGQAFFVLTALASGPRHGYGIVGEVAELSQLSVRRVLHQHGQMAVCPALSTPPLGQEQDDWDLGTR